MFHEFGGPEKLVFQDMPDPEIGPGEVLVRVRACALNHLDIWVRKGLRGKDTPLPHILGSDISGSVERVGDSSPNIKLGDTTVISPGISCGTCEACLSGRDNFCRSYQIIGGYQEHGGYAELVKVPRENVLPMPQNLKFEEAAAVPLVFLTAWHMLVSRASIRPGETVLVIGAGSGVGSAAIQIAKLHGGRVIATAGGEEKIRKATDLGADDTIDHSKDDILDNVKSLTSNKGVDIVIEHVGTATWEKSLKSLAPGGRMVTCGATTGSEGLTDIRYVFAKQLSILGSYMGSKSELVELLRFFEQGKLKPVVDRVMPLEEAAEAHRIMEERKQFGKIVLSPPFSL